MQKACIRKYKQLVKTSTKQILRYLMELTIEQALQQGVAAHKEGKVQDAEKLYRAILQSQPLHPDANHNLGLIAVSVNKADAALALFKTALEANPKIEQFWLSYINALIKENQFDNAKQVLEQGKNQGVVGEKVDALEEHLFIADMGIPERLDDANDIQIISVSEVWNESIRSMALLITSPLPKIVLRTPMLIPQLEMRIVLP